MRPIWFLKSINQGSAFHRGDVPKEMLNRAGYFVRSAFYQQLRELPSNSIVVLVKHCSGLIERLKERNNIVIWDMVDATGSQAKEQPEVHGIIHPNTRSIPKDQTQEHTIIHHFSFNPPFEIKEDRNFGVVYCGDATECKLSESHTDVESLIYHPILSKEHETELDFLTQLSKYPFHISVRKTPFKPQTKISIAAKFKACLICNRDAGAVDDLLPDDYPYLCEPTVVAVRRCVEYARKTYLTDVWDKARAMMDATLEVSSDESIVESYIEFFQRLELKHG